MKNNNHKSFITNYLRIWGSNPVPLACEVSALPVELIPREKVLYILFPCLYFLVCIFSLVCPLIINKRHSQSMFQQSGAEESLLGPWPKLLFDTTLCYVKSNFKLRKKFVCLEGMVLPIRLECNCCTIQRLYNHR